MKIETLKLLGKRRDRKMRELRELLSLRKRIRMALNRDGGFPTLVNKT